MNRFKEIISKELTVLEALKKLHHLKVEVGDKEFKTLCSDVDEKSRTGFINDAAPYIFYRPDDYHDKGVYIGKAEDGQREYRPYTKEEKSWYHWLEAQKKLEEPYISC